MEKIISVTQKFEVSIANQECLKELARFVVEENYKHHSTNSVSKEELESEIMAVYNEERTLFSDTSLIYIARYNHKIIGSIRVYKWDKKKELPIEKLYGINPLEAISQDRRTEYWHIGRFAIDSSSGISTIHLFKQLMVYAVSPIMQSEYGYMVAEVDAKLLKVVNALGIHTINLGKSIYHLSSKTIPVYASQKGITPFYQHYQGLCNNA